MTKRDVLSVAMKIIGVFSLIATIQLLPYLILVLQAQYFPEVAHKIWIYGMYFLVLVVDLAIAFVLLRYSNAIAAKLVRNDKEMDIAISSRWDRRAFKLCIRIIGILTVIKGLVALVQNTNYLIYRFYQATSDVLIQWNKIFAPIVLIIVGVYLICGGKFIINMAYRKRGGYISKEKGLS